MTPVASLFVVFLGSLFQERGPVEFAKAELARRVAHTPPVSVSIESGKRDAEGFHLRVAKDGVRVVAGGPSGAMYGILEAAEWIDLVSPAALGDYEVERSPYLKDRGVNLFLTLPWDTKKNRADQDPAALGDAARWWFHSDDYWHTLLDSMARARLNWLDIHGAYDLDSTRFPNLYAYFIQSEQFPEVGVAPSLKAKNLARLNQVIEWAHARGIRVSLMSYEAQFWIPQKPKVPYETSESNLYEYTKEVVEKSIRQIPGLDAIGFRIGESGHGGEFFRCYTEAVAASGRDIPLLTRSWVTRKEKVVPLARASSDFTVEIKYNGEQWGPPYPIAGGRVPNFYSYSFEDYLSDSDFVRGAGGAVPRAQHLWPGHAASNGGTWPAQPYKIVWQVRANGTHRIFPFYNPEWVRRSIECMKMGTASGFTVEPMNAYYPASPDYYLKDPASQPWRWIHERDWPAWLLWGRLGYDPKTVQGILDTECSRFLAKDRASLVAAWTAASRVVPLAFTMFAFGPDHRDHAPELEWGGDTPNFIESKPFDSHAIMSIQEELAIRATGGKDGRMTQEEVSALLADAAAATDANPQPAPAIWPQVRMLGPLGRYYVARMAAAKFAALAETVMNDDAKAAAAAAMARAVAEWKKLAANDLYKPFTDRLRLGTHDYRWENELSKVESEAKRLGPAPPGTEAPAPKRRPDPGATLEVEASRDMQQIVCRVRGAHVSNAWILHKPLPSSTYFHKIPAQPEGSGFSAVLPYENWGHMIAAEVEYNGSIVRIPDWTKETPWRVVAAKPGPTPQIYSFEEALLHLDPAALDPGKVGLLILGPRAWDFHTHYNVSMQRKVIDAVERGCTLILFQQDWTSGRYPLRWLPDPPAAENYASNVFDPGGALGLQRIECSQILSQRFRPSPGWEIHGDGSVAHRTYGRGEIWIVAARLMQRMHVAECAKALVHLLAMNGNAKPAVLLDANSEGPRYSNSVFPDLMNAQGVPFITIGELVAREQGMGSNRIVPGIVTPGAILENKGSAMVQRNLAAMAKAAAARPVPPSAAEFESERARRRIELYKSLGLAFPPGKSPLNPQITGTLERKGYRIEKLVFESRPGFHVTAHLYIPDGAKSSPRPVVVNPNGHWSHKKNEPVVQARAAAQALLGYVAITVDSPGWSFEGNAKIERRFQGTHDDYRLIASSSNTTALYVYDLMRALDYLETRPEADMKKIAITGCSGGGLATVYAFAADDRYTCAIPVCYATSLEVSTANGCLCNHVPGTLQIGDRADVLSIQAPKPVFLIGATDDGEFPPQGHEASIHKMKSIWGLLGAAGNVKLQIFPSGHDYNKSMREAAYGFLQLHLRGIGDGSPVAEPELQLFDAEAPELFCQKDVPGNVRTMRDIAVDRLRSASFPARSFEDVIALNGGLPPAGSLARTVVGAPARRSQPDLAESFITIETSPGISVPGVELSHIPGGMGVLVYINDAGAAAARTGRVAELLATPDPPDVVAIDPRGIGELANLDGRLMAYLGVAPAFLGGADAARVAEYYINKGKRVVLAGDGPVAALMALFAGHMQPRIHGVATLRGLKDDVQCFDPAISAYAVQPRADCGAPLSAMRQWLKPRAWHRFAGEPDPNADEWRKAIADLLR